MALDVAEFLWTKFLSSLEEADSELSGSTFFSYFRAIKNVVKKTQVLPEPYTYCDSIRMLYELNDALPECRIFIRDCNKRNKKLLLFNPLTHVFAHRMKGRLTRIKEDLMKLAVQRERDRENLAAAREEIRKPPDLITVKGPILSLKVFGFEKYVEKIEGLLEGGSSHAPFMGIGVVGIAGVGKTTLVRKVLESERVKGEFNPIIWLPFSGMWEEEGGFSAFTFEAWILDNLGNAVDKKIVGIGKLLEMLNQILSGKRYLIVLDDVCHRHITIEERLWHGLPKCGGGAVIVTSRSAEVANKLVKQNNLVIVEPLDKEKCWLIFLETINEKDFSSIAHRETLKRIEDEIKDQCHGLPLAAKTLAEIIAE
ncbi:disease resistance RPP13-like protein 4 [Prunus avium]|uniref:Disease resistance RPP13-like protein 4 n=1 Tax=Prunus avium TaxID=42229 RepID=A0A6P5RJZ3_PRUAV|nr:disease resistance RPP13-like protein 4 [Prunus avium]